MKQEITEISTENLTKMGYEAFKEINAITNRAKQLERDIMVIDAELTRRAQAPLPETVTATEEPKEA